MLVNVSFIVFDAWRSRWASYRHAAEAGGHAKAGRQATYLLIRPRRKSPCIYFEWADAGTGGGARADTDAGLAPKGFPSAPRASPRGHVHPRLRCRVPLPASTILHLTGSLGSLLTDVQLQITPLICNLFAEYSSR